jgi:general secretion pathway protein A
MYTHFYGFSEEPFRDTPDPRFLFSIPGHQRTLGCLTQGIEEKSGWVLLSGEPGSGKTILIHHLLQTLKGRPGVKTVFIFQTRISFEDLLKEILAELNLLPVSPTGGAPIAEHFTRSVSQVLSPEDTLVLFLDEAQDFSVAVLERISHFFCQEYQRPEQVQIILSGQPLLEEKLQSQALHHLNQRIKVRCPIKPFSPQESQRYIEHRLHLVGGSSDLFTPEALNRVIRYGEGIPRTLNIICDNSLRIGHQISETKISVEIVRKALQEMCLQTGRRRASWETTKKRSVFKKILYSLAAIIGLLMVIFCATEYSQQEKGNVIAKAEGTPAKIRKEEPPPPPVPKPEEKPPQEKEAESIPSVKEPVSGPPRQTTLPAPASLKESKAEAKFKKIINVKKGATLNSYCWEHYGFTNITLLDHIMVLNPELANPNLILVNQKIILPEIEEEFLVQEKPGGKVQVFLGTFAYSDIAQTFKETPLLKGKEIEITPRKIVTGETWHRMSAGRFADKEEALKIVRALKEEGLLPSFGGTPQKNGKNA